MRTSTGLTKLAEINYHEIRGPNGTDAARVQLSLFCGLSRLFLPTPQSVSPNGNISVVFADGCENESDKRPDILHANC
jgi:hypothetical protein